MLECWSTINVFERVVELKSKQKNKKVYVSVFITINAGDVYF